MIRACDPSLSKVTVRIGNGNKLHPAWAEKVIKDPGGPWAQTSWKHFRFVCYCPNTRNGWASLMCSVVCEGWESANCNHKES